MATRFFVVDSGGTSRLIRRLGVVDSGGTARMLKRLFAIDSGGTARLVFRASLLETTLNIGDNGGTEWGFESLGSPFGSIDDDTYTDAGSTSRTIATVKWSSSPAVAFRLSGTSIPDSDDTFTSISIDGNVLTRASATYTASIAGCTQWAWASDLTALTSGSVPFVIL